MGFLNVKTACLDRESRDSQSCGTLLAPTRKALLWEGPALLPGQLHWAGCSLLVLPVDMQWHAGQWPVWVFSCIRPRCWGWVDCLGSTRELQVLALRVTGRAHTLVTSKAVFWVRELSICPPFHCVLSVCPPNSARIPLRAGLVPRHRAQG